MFGVIQSDSQGTKPGLKTPPGCLVTLSTKLSYAMQLIAGARGGQPHIAAISPTMPKRVPNRSSYALGRHTSLSVITNNVSDKPSTVISPTSCSICTFNRFHDLKATYRFQMINEHLTVDLNGLNKRGKRHFMEKNSQPQ